jgi:acyl-coenzyme A synthetase/AMP-(fatty) acid ligase
MPEGTVSLCDRSTDDLSTFLTNHPSPGHTKILHWMSGSATLDDLTSAAWALAELLGPLSGAPVACVVDHGFDAVVAMFGTWLSCGVYVPINGRLPDAELHRQLAATAPAMVLTGAGQSARIPAGFHHLVALGANEWWSKPGADWQGRSFPEGSALVMRTSGTTGSAKPIPLRHDGIRDGIDTVIARLRGKAATSNRAVMPNLVPTSLALWAGIWNMLFAFRLGAPVVLMDRFDPVDYLTLVKRFDIRSTILAPAMMTMLTTDPRVTDLAPLRLVRSVTAPLLPDQARRFHDRFGVDVLNSYGQTELGGEVVGWTAGDVREFGDAKLGAVGRPHPGVSVRVLDQDHRPLPANERGEVYVSSPFATEESDRLVDGHLRTGDLGRLDEDGFLWIEGRVSDLINRGGLKVLPQEVEAALGAHPDVAEACVAGVPDERLGEVPVAWVRPRPDKRPDPTALRSYLRERLAPYQVPVAVHLVDGDFPRTEVGKVLRRELVADHLRED